MKTELKKLKVKFEGNIITIDIAKELSINENIINSQLRESPTSYYILCSLRDKYIKERDALARERMKLILLLGYLLKNLMKGSIMIMLLIRLIYLQSISQYINGI